MRFTGRVALHALIILFAFAAESYGLIVPVGNEFQISSFTGGDQRTTTVTADSAGNFVVVWNSSGQDGGGLGVFGRRFSSSGTSLGTEFQVSTHTSDNEFFWRAGGSACSSTTGFIVTWTTEFQDGESFGIFAQRFSSSGAQAGTEFQVNTTTIEAQDESTISCASDGRFVIAWEAFGDQDGNSDGIFAQRFGSDGSPASTEFQVNSFTPGDQENPTVSLDSSGNFMIAWFSFHDGDSLGTFAQRFSSSGNRIGNEFQVNSYTTGAQGDFPATAVVSTTPSGEFVVAWESGPYGRDGSDLGSFAQRYSSTGLKVGAEFQANTYTTGNQSVRDAHIFPTGEFVIVWESYGQDGSGYAIRGQGFDPLGVRDLPEFDVNTFTSGDQMGPSVTGGPAGQLIVTWESDGQDGSGTGVFGRRFVIASHTSTSTPTATPTTTSTSTETPTATITSVPTQTLIPLCSGGPLACKVAGITKFILRNPSTDERDKTKFRWTRGDATTINEFGDPTVDTQYTMCVWDESAGSPNLVMEMVAQPGGNCSGKPCWQSIGGGTGYRYKDLGRLPHGIQQVVLKSGAGGFPSVFVKGFGAALPDPPMPFQQDSKITVQLVNSIGNCWGADYVTAAVVNTTQNLTLKERP